MSAGKGGGSKWGYIDVGHLLFVGLRLFGESYSGLEYDYRGLCHIYEVLNDLDKYIEYSRILDNWRNLRRRNEALEVSRLMLRCDGD